MDDDKVSELKAAVAAIIEAATLKTARPVLLLLDGLDRIESREHSRQLFARSTLLSELPGALVVSAPVVMALDGHMHEAHGFERPRILVCEPVFQVDDPRALGPGVKFFHQLCAARLEGLGGMDRVSTDAVDLLAWSSGGLLRHFVRMFRDACAEAQFDGVMCIERDHADRAVADFRRMLKMGVSSERAAILREVRRAPARPVPVTGSVDWLLVTGRLLPYGNGEDWFYPHPLLLDFIRDDD